MYELSVACKYLIPKWKQLSVSIISLISISVIALVVWLIVVFFSVTHGLEKGWIQKLVALTAPVRIVPTEAFYDSYYYLIDSASAESDYSLKSLSEKLQAEHTDPYDPSIDGEIPTQWNLPDLDLDGSLKDLAKKVVQSVRQISDVPGLTIRDYENAAGNLRLHLSRYYLPKPTESTLSQATYLGIFDPDNPQLLRTLQPLMPADEQNVLAHPIHTQKDRIFLPKSFRDAGVLVGDQGYLYYHAVAASSVQEQQVPVYVAGFYDPGIIPLGGKYVLTNRELVSLIRSSQQQTGTFFNNGFNVQFEDFNQADQVKTSIETALKKEGVQPYWRVETYKEYEFTKDLIQQLQSERHLWTLIAMVILIIACSNIISMLVILVNNKRLEIGILRSMGASSFSIALIFGTCGMGIGLIGSAIGVGIAVLTLNHLQALVHFIGRIQGYEMFNPLFYGDLLPNELSLEALTLVVVATGVFSLLAGIVPAIKACWVRPSTILRSE